MKSFQVDNDFSAGELAPEALQAKDSRAVQNGLKKARNIRQRNGGGFSRRPGTRKQAVLLENSNRGFGYAYDSTYQYSLIFSPGRMDAYLDDGTASGSITTGTWAVGDLLNLSIAPIDERIILSEQVLGLFEIERTGVATWTIDPFAFDAGAGGSLTQPYYRYAAKGITITPSALTGAGITVTASSAVFSASHVGTRIRYVGKEILITGYTSPTQVTGTVIQTLPGTYTITLGTSVGFQIGQIVEGDVSGTTGQITAIPSAVSLTVLIISGLSGFSATEKIVGPDAQSTASAVASAAIAASVIWDEQAASAVRGYPGEVQVHRRRLGLTKWRDAPEAWNFSGTSSIADFDVGQAEDNEAIGEILTASPREGILHYVPAENLLLLTDRNVYYVPEGRENVLTPTYASLFKAARVGSYSCDPVIVEQGVLLVDVSQTRVWLVAPTGQITSPWAATDISRLVPQLMRAPFYLSSSDGNVQAPERYAYAMNGDGTAAVLFYRDDDPIYGWCLWETQGSWINAWTLNGVEYGIFTRSIDGVTTWFLEKFDETALLDCSTTFTDPDGDVSLAYLAGETVLVVELTATGWANYGEFLVGVGGTLPAGLPTDGGHTFEAGFGFAVEAETISPVLVESVQASGPKLRIPRAWLTTQDSGSYKVNGQIQAAYLEGEDDSALAPLRDGTKKWHFRGRSASPTVSITQDADLPSPLTVLSLTMEVVG